MLLSSRVHLVREKALGIAQHRTTPLWGWRSVCRAKLESCQSDSWCFPSECLRASPRQWQQLWKSNLPILSLTNLLWVSLSQKKPLFRQLKSFRQPLAHVRVHTHTHTPASFRDTALKSQSETQISGNGSIASLSTRRKMETQTTIFIVKVSCLPPSHKFCLLLSKRYISLIRKQKQSWPDLLCTLSLPGSYNEFVC